MYIVLICTAICSIIECRQISSELNSNESTNTNQPINNAILQKPHSFNVINPTEEYDGNPHSSLYKPPKLPTQSKTVRYKPKRDSEAEIIGNGDEGSILMKGVHENANSNLKEEITKLKGLMKILKDQQAILDTINDDEVAAADKKIEPDKKYEAQQKELIQLKGDVKSLKELLLKTINGNKFAEISEKEMEFQKELKTQKEEIDQLKSVIFKLVNKKKSSNNTPQTTATEHVPKPPTTRSNNKVLNQLQALEKQLEKILADNNINNSLDENENAILGSPIQRLFANKPPQQSKPSENITVQSHNRMRTASNDEEDVLNLLADHFGINTNRRPLNTKVRDSNWNKNKAPSDEAKLINHSAIKAEINTKPRASGNVDIDSLIDLLDRTESKTTSTELDENTALLNELQKLSKRNKKDDINVKLKKLQKQIKHLQDLDSAKNKSLDDDDSSDQIKRLKLQLKLLQSKESKHIDDDDNDDLESNLKSLEKAIDSLRPKDDDFDLDLDLEEKVVSNNDKRFQLLINKLFSKNKQVQVSNQQPSSNQQIALLIKRLTAANRPVQSVDDHGGYEDNYEDNGGNNLNGNGDYDGNSDGGRGGSYSGGHSPSSYSGSGHTGPYGYGSGGRFHGDAATYGKGGGGVGGSYSHGTHTGGGAGIGGGSPDRLYGDGPGFYNTGYGPGGASLYGGYGPEAGNVLYGAASNGVGYGGVAYGPGAGMYGHYGFRNPYGYGEYGGGENKYGTVQLYGANAYSKGPTSSTYSSKVNKSPMPSYNPYNGNFDDGSLYGNNPGAGMYPNKNGAYGSGPASANYVNTGNGGSGNNLGGNSYTSPAITSGGSKYGASGSSANNNNQNAYGSGPAGQSSYSGNMAETDPNYKGDESGNHPFPAYQGAANPGPGNMATYESSAATSAANNQQPYENPPANKPGYTRQKVTDLQTEIYDLQNVINGFNRPQYTQKPEDQETVYNLNKQIGDLKNVMSNLNNENSDAPNTDYIVPPVQVDTYQEAPKQFAEDANIPDTQQSHPTARKPSRRPNRQIKTDIHAEESKEADEMLEGITSFIDNILQKDEEVPYDLRTPEEEQPMGRSNNPELEHVKEKLKDLRKKLGMRLQQKPSNPLEKSAHQPSYGNHQPYQDYQNNYQGYEEESGKKDKGKGAKKEGKKLEIFDKVFTKILDKLIDKAGIAIPKLIEAFFGFGNKDSISEYSHGDYDNYKGGDYGYGDLEKTFKGFGLSGYLPMIIIKLMTNLGTFVNYLKKYKFLKTFMVPALVVVLVGGLIIFLIWFLQPGDEQYGSIGYENYGGGNPYGYSDGYSQQGGYYEGGGGGYRNNEIGRSNANDNNLRDNTNAISNSNQYKNSMENNDNNHNSNSNTYYTDYNHYNSLYPNNYYKNKR